MTDPQPNQPYYDFTWLHDPEVAAIAAPDPEEMDARRERIDQAAMERAMAEEPPTLRVVDDAPDPREDPAFEDGEIDLGEPAQKVSAGPDVPPAESNGLAFRRASELAAMGTPTVRWIAEQLVALGAISELAGKVKLSGKTTLVLALTRAVIEGEPFLGRPTMRSPVVILTEQPPASFLEALRRAGLLEAYDLTILFFGDAVGVPWADVVARAVDECDGRGAQLLIVDTLGQWARVRGDAENDAGAAMAAMEPLQAAAAGGLAVLVARHDRKGPGQLGESARGSSAFSGAVDIVLHLRRPDGQQRPGVRVLEGLSRFDVLDETYIELGDDGVYRLLGDAATIEGDDTRAELLERLPAAPADGLAMNDVLERLPDRKRTTVQEQLRILASAGHAERVGAGKRGDPYRWRLTENLSAGTPPLRGVSAEGGLGPPLAPAPSEAPEAAILSAGTPTRRGKEETEGDLRGDAVEAFAELGGEWASP